MTGPSGTGPSGTGPSGKRRRPARAAAAALSLALAAPLLGTGLVGSGLLGIGLLTSGLLGPGARAGEAQDRLFALGALDAVETGETLVYDYSRRGTWPGDEPARLDHGEARLTVEPPGADGAQRARAEVRDGETVIGRFNPFPVDAGNPMFMVFMEEAVSTMATLTGGSSFYIRNRMREALASQNAVEETTVSFDGRSVPARVLTFQPFLNDRNANKMGPAFVDLTIRFTMSDEIPGGFARMEAVTGPAAAAPAPAGSAPEAGEPAGEPLVDMSFNLAKVEEG
ncbi:hypothetical protein [Amaricoccus sp. W119]|uniref:hypothetical protein n=1 Tax=Amaricoccus sp. W119 TaxID=3391833 RepID=UPI0039A731A4